MRILLVEDEQKLADLLAAALEKDGFSADVVASAEDAKELLNNFRYDAVILDLGLPGQDGMEFLETMRSRGLDVPVLITSARETLGDRLGGLGLGADDYLTKPFDPREMIARIRAILRRPGARLGIMLTAGNLELDTVSRNLAVDGRSVALTRREMSILELLMRSIGRVVPKSVLEDKLYGIDDEPESNPVPVHIHHLRKDLSEAGAKLDIHTVRGVGYLLAQRS